MNSSSVTHKGLGLMGILCGFLVESAASLPFVAPEVIWIVAEQAFWFHLAGAVLTSAGAAALLTSGRGIAQWVGTTFLFSLFALLLPLVGLFTILILTMIVVSHHARVRPEKIKLAEVRPVRVAPSRDGALYGPGPLAQPLVSVIHRKSASDLRKIVLGIESAPPALTRPVLHKLQKHADVRVQLYANGLLNDQLDVLERRLATLKHRVADRPGDEEAQTAVIEVYEYLFANHLVASDEIGQTARQGLRETECALALNPSNPIVLHARAEFQLLLGDFRDAAIAIEQLRHLPGQEKAAAELHARLLFEFAAAQDVPATPPSSPGNEHRNRAAL